ncbi:hypothetical protein [Helicobacter mustelae]|uniref:hypothetical protein n=1 Tax=Helicobacter mustelae TaxID=217 RepID=UPI000E0F6A25|nr:hypothetical protein [Helicobacter mustelae]
MLENLVKSAAQISQFAKIPAQKTKNQDAINLKKEVRQKAVTQRKQEGLIAKNQIGIKIDDR